ncbi:long-chain acyl-CoA synthetase [Propionibacteriaceae bacterium ES.041]|uniref:long-chain-fatty-acid--CoA ligase n=1 Tax=Enemella evansiae TaxID=2016499 RepID=UPI000B96F919|nr:long-chain fatty acid--CoA ligase [Enemella evansiae]OYN94129.1 long-chain-fatty-acid--CoA ligase [Enemella evansiae]PFG68572.1 long-chain acyl-CoA synthetase [Propionibacteriaceae bacterium ES.041]
MPNIATWLKDRAASDPDRPAVKQGDTVLTYAALDDASSRAAARLAEMGIGPGDHVALTMPNVAYFPVVYYGILRLGAVVVPMNPLLKGREVAYTWTDADAKAAVVFAMFAEAAQEAASETGTPVWVVTPGEFEKELGGLEPRSEVVDRDGSDTAIIFYTSGTTGRPKGAELSHDNILTNVRTTVETLFDIGTEDVIFGGLPLFHSFGQTCSMNAGVAGGACLDLLPRFDGAEALRMIAEDKVTLFMGVPTMYMGLLAAAGKGGDHDTSTLRLGASGGASLPVEVLNGVQQALNFKLLEGYGLSETSPVATFNHPDRPAKPGSIGTPIRGVEVKLVNADGNEVHETDTVGEIWIRGENVMKGYWGKPEETAEAIDADGWFRTGDLATRDDEGYYFIVDRKKDMIIRNAFNVYPREIEEVLYTHPAVAEAAVIGIPDEQVGEEIAAVVTLKEGAEATEQELIDFAKGQLAAYKYPRKLKFGTLPKGPTGKILKREIDF